MGRGIAYYNKYESNYLLVDIEMMVIPIIEEMMESNGWDEEEIEPGTDLYHEISAEELDFFKDHVKDLAEATMTTPKWIGRETLIFAHNDYFKIGLDYSGGCPALFFVPKEFQDTEELEDTNEAEFDKQKKAFNDKVQEMIDNLISRLIKGYTDTKILGKATTPWTANWY